MGHRLRELNPRNPGPASLAISVHIVPIRQSGTPACSAFLAAAASPSRTLRAAADSLSIRNSRSLSSSDSGVQSPTNGTSFGAGKWR